MTNEEALKPCPFCGGNASIKPKEITQGYEFYVSCDKCKAQTGVSIISDYSEIGRNSAKLMLSLVWNNRVSEVKE